jgi:hypothetical protein
MRIIDDHEWLFGDPAIDRRIADMKPRQNALEFTDILDIDASVQMVCLEKILTVSQATRIMCSIGRAIDTIDQYTRLCAAPYDPTYAGIRCDLIRYHEQLLKCLTSNSGLLTDSVAV